MEPDLSYDAQAPFDLTVQTVARRGTAVISACRFANVEGAVDGYLVTPAAGERAPAGVVYQHTTGGREAFLPEAIQVAEAGGAALCLPFVAVADPVAMLRQSIFAIRRRFGYTSGVLGWHVLCPRAAAHRAS